MKLKKSIPYIILGIFLGTVFLVWAPQSASKVFSGDSALVLISLGGLAGLLLEVAMLFQLMLIGRISFIENAFGHDKLNKVHRVSGYSLSVLVLAHPVLLIWGYSRFYGDFWNTFINLVTSWEGVVYAFIAFIILFAVIVISLPWIRKRLRYEVWQASHLLVYVVLLLTISHEFNAGDIEYGNNKYYWATLLTATALLYGYYRFIRPVVVFFKHGFYVDRIVKESEDIYSVYIKGKNIGNFKYKAGQFANYYFLTKGFLFAHPFSFSCAPNNDYIRISIKNLGKYTGRIANLKFGTKVLIDGPLGTFTTENAKTGKFLFLGGGIGITPIRSMMEDASVRENSVLIYGARKLNDAALLDELTNFSTRTHVVLSDEKIEGFDGGRIDLEKIKKYAPDFRDRDIYICGPTGMMDSIIALLKLENIPRSQIHFEKFSY